MTHFHFKAILILALLGSLPTTNADEAVLHDLILRAPDTTITNAAESHIGWLDDNHSQIGFLLRPEPNTMAPVLIEINNIPLPNIHSGIETLTLHFSSELHTSGNHTNRPPAAIFAVRINDQEIWRDRQENGKPLSRSIDLTTHAGKAINLLFILDAEIARTAMTGLIIQPEIRIKGTEEALRTASQNFSLTIPTDWMADPNRPINPPAISRMRSEFAQRGTAVAIATMDPELDLDFAVRRELNNGYFSLVPPAPAIAAGEGPHPDNHTIVRVLSPHGTRESQFLAYPPDIKGGVLVESGRDGRRRHFIATTPATNTQINEIRIFTRGGAHFATLQPDKSLQPPFRIAVGNFRLDHPGDEIAIAGTHKDGATIEIHRLQQPTPITSFLLQDWQLPELSTGPRGQLIAHSSSKNSYATIEPNADAPLIWPLPANSNFHHLSHSPFNPHELFATIQNSNSPSFSLIDRNLEQHSITHSNRETKFWIGIPESWRTTFPPDTITNPRQSIHTALPGHIRVDGLAANIASSPQSNTPPPNALRAYFYSLGLLAPLDQQRPRLWNPNSSNAQFPELFASLAIQTDSRTGLPTFHMLHRSGNPTTSTSNGKQFQNSSMALEIHELDTYYHQPLRTFLRHFAPAYRAAPDSLPLLNPSQTIQFSGYGEASLGDYNPIMIQAFVDHLRLHYGDDTTALRTRFHLPDNGPIDAPRNLRRGPWDNYSDDNPFFKEWLDFNVHAINRMHAAGCREALLAGFPPELIKGQFIPTPNNPATGPATTILANSPATYAMIAGTGFGFGNPDPDHTNTQSTLHLARAAHSSGFHSIAIHQSHPSTNDPSDALQWLQSLRQFGTHSIQFNNPTEADATSLQTTHAAMQKAIQSLANETETTNIPPLQSSGTHQIRPFTNNDTPIAILSTTSGLIQSIHADGSHEGSVFVVPFHTRLAIEEINFHPSETTQQSAPFTLTPGAQIDIDFHVSNAISPGPIEFKILRHGQPLPGLYGQLPVSSNQTAMRLQFRCHSTIDNLTVEITPPPNASLSIHTATIQSPMTASLNANGNKGTPHKGGIFFTLLD